MKNRNVTLRKIVHARWDIPVIHTPHRYTMVCVDNFKKYFARESQSEPTVRPLVAQSNVGAGSRLIQNSIEHGTRVFVTLASVARMLSPEADNRAASESEVKVTLNATEAGEPIRKHFSNVS